MLPIISNYLELFVSVFLKKYFSSFMTEVPII